MAISEDDLIAKYFAPLSGVGAFNLSDDAALTRNKEGHDIVTTTDTVAAGVDFFHDATPEEVAAKALRVNLSDLAAKGADAFGYLLALSLPAMDEDWLEKFAAQLARDQETYHVTLLGGDTTRTNQISLTVMAFGHVPHGKMVMRKGAKAGDLVVVSGVLGEAALGLQALQGKLEGDYPSLLQRYAFPQPRNALAPLLRECASAAMDISDGFIGDLIKLCRTSGVSANIDLEKLPHSQEALAIIARDEQWRDVALTGGDDYEILAILPPQKWSLFESEAKKLDVPVTVVGEIVEGNAPPVFTYKKEPRTFAGGSYRHF